MKYSSYLIVLIIFLFMSCSEQDSVGPAEPSNLVVIDVSPAYDRASSYLLVSYPDNSLIDFAELTPGDIKVIAAPDGFDGSPYNTHLVRYNAESNFVGITSKLLQNSDTIRIGYDGSRRGPFLANVSIEHGDPVVDPNIPGAYVLHAGSYYEYSPYQFGYEFKIPYFPFYANANAIFYYRYNVNLPSGYYFNPDFIPESSSFSLEDKLRPLSEAGYIQFQPTEELYIFDLTVDAILKPRDGYVQAPVRVHESHYGYALRPFHVFYPRDPEYVDGFTTEARFSKLDNYSYRSISRKTSLPVLPEPTETSFTLLNKEPGAFKLEIDGNYDGFSYAYRKQLDQKSFWWEVNSPTLDANYSAFPEIPLELTVIAQIANLETLKTPGIIPGNDGVSIRVFENDENEYREVSGNE